MGVLLGIVVLGAALWACWHFGLPLVGSLARDRKGARPVSSERWYDRGAPDRQVSELEKVPGAGTAEDRFDEIVAPLRQDRALTRVIRRARL